LSLRQRLAQTYAGYRTALATVEEYRDHTLPGAREAYALYLDAFRNPRAAWPQVLVAQRTYFQSSVDYVRALEQLRRAEVDILGLLLVDALPAY
jgi:cobalt-zinc-cadmium efflux system outer membrane protein